VEHCDAKARRALDEPEQGGNCGDRERPQSERLESAGGGKSGKKGEGREFHRRHIVATPRFYNPARRARNTA
jgi:hypothetical protein